VRDSERTLWGGGTKKDRKIALVSLYLYYTVPCMKIQVGHGPPSPAFDAHVPKTHFKYSKSIAQ